MAAFRIRGALAACEEVVEPGEVRRFGARLQASGLGPLVRGTATTLQVNVGKRCNQACHHCHVEAGPKRTEVMSRAVAEQVVRVVAQSPEIERVDVTGGAPELNPSFRWMVEQIRGLGRRVMDRCNLTVLFEPGMEDLPAFLAEHRVEVIASLPCYIATNVDKQRGRGVFDKSIDGLRRLNELGYGDGSSGLLLDLVYNPLGPYLPPDQEGLRAQYEAELDEHFGVRFDRLLTITNMPIARFADQLRRTGRLDEYMALLVNHFNPATVPDLMCRSLVSVGWDGRLFDCDFNQMLDLELCGEAPVTLFDIASCGELTGRTVVTAEHCFGCTAGAGSSCGGALE